MKTKLTLLLTTILTSFLFSQNISRFNCEIEVNGKTIDYPFIGGLNSPQFNTMDINLDGLEDLIVFDRVGNKLNVFINKNNKYVYSPEYNDIFPKVEYWMSLVDYDNDGIKDLFKSSGYPDIEVWKGIENNNKIYFEKYHNPYYGKDILSKKVSNTSNHQAIENLQSDIPAIIDIDNDGDIDILSFYNGNSLKLYKNLCIEKNLSLDSFLYIFTTTCWGRFEEGDSNSIIDLSPNPDRCASQAIISPRHAGSSTLILDMDDDGDYDILLGDIQYDSLIYLKNGGSLNKPWMTEIDREFPSYDIPVAIKSFVAAFFIDVDFDGIKDLIVSPNEDYDYKKYPQTVDNVHFYKNTNSNKKPIFKYIKSDFLVDKMLDLGGNTSPTFIDVNKDGLIDIIVGSSPKVFFDAITASRLYYFKNIGTKTTPKFKLENDNYLQMSAISQQYDLNYFTPSFGDLDGDGDLDLVVGNHTGTLIYFKNKAGKNNPLNFESPIINYKNIDIKSYSSPCIFDHNNDGLGDLIIGCGQNFNQGQLNLGGAVYFENIGSINDADFNNDPFVLPNNSFYGELNFDYDFSHASYASPTVYKDNKTELLITGLKNGKIHIYKDFRNHRYDKLTASIKEYGDIDVGSHSAPTVADIDNDGFLELLIGTRNGGLELWNTDIAIDSDVSTTDNTYQKKVDIFPNPTHNYINVMFKNKINKNIKYKLTNIWGETVKNGELNYYDNKINLNLLLEGVYLLSLNLDGRIYTRKIIKFNNKI